MPARSASSTLSDSVRRPQPILSSRFCDVRLVFTNSTATGGSPGVSASSAASPTWTSPLSTTTFDSVSSLIASRSSRRSMRVAVPLVVVRSRAVGVDQLDLDERLADEARAARRSRSGTSPRGCRGAASAPSRPRARRGARPSAPARGRSGPSCESPGGGIGSSRRVRVSSMNSSASEPIWIERKTRSGSVMIRAADGQPLLARLERGGPPRRPRAVALRLVLGRAVSPRAVGELVVVDRRDERVGRADGLDVGVAAVLGVAGPVVVERAALVERVERPPDVPARGLARRRRLGCLVDPVAEVEHERDVVALGQSGVGVEVARVVLGARHLAEADRRRRRRRAASGSGPAASDSPSTSNS